MQSSSVTVSTLRAMEGRQDKLRAQLAGVKDAALLAEAKSTELTGELGRPSRKVSSAPIYSSPTPRPLFRNY
jgi:hypothetical protein